jgi:hypothetical protein
MKIGQIEETISKVKSFINADQEESFQDLATQLYRLHYEMNDVYYNFCGRKIAETWEDIPLLPIEAFQKNQVRINLETEMPFPGVLFLDGKSKHYMRDTELYKDSIARSFPNIVLNETSWVPWINFVGLSEKQSNSSIHYVLEYLAESFHGCLQSSLIDFNQLIDAEGEEIKIQIPTVFMATKNSFKNFLKTYDENISSYPEGIILSLGSKLVEIQNNFDFSSAKVTSKLLKIFGLTQMTRILAIPEISSQFYATMNMVPIEYALVSERKETAEFFMSHWVKFRILNENTNEDVEPGCIGRVAVYDLANAWSCPFVLTNYYGKVGNNGGLVFSDGNLS